LTLTCRGCKKYKNTSLDPQPRGEEKKILGGDRVEGWELWILVKNWEEGGKTHKCHITSGLSRRKWQRLLTCEDILEMSGA